MTAPDPIKDRYPGAADDDVIDLGELVGLLLESRWLIVGAAALCLFLGIAYALLATPIYRADALVQVEQNQGKLGGTDELAMLLGQTDMSSAITEIEILKSRSVIGDVVEKQGLTIAVAPRRLPVIGGFLARFAGDEQRLVVSRLDVADGTGDFILASLGEGRYLLRDEDGAELLQGRAGEPAESADGRVSLFVSELVAEEGARFDVSKRDHYAVVRGLQQAIQVSEKGRGTSLLAIGLEGADRERIRDIVHGLTQSYLRQNVERRSEESERMLEFIQTQMPTMRTDLDAAEQALNLYREEAGTIDLSLESRALIDRLTQLETEISALGIERTELLQKLTVNHPVIHGLDQKIRGLKEQVAELEGQLRHVPEKELESVKLSRDVQVASELYMLLLNKSQELKVAKAGTLGNVRIVDTAVTGAEPVKPKKALVAALSLVLGLILGVVLAVLRKALNKAVQDPAVIERQLGYAVYAEVPFSAVQAEASRKRGRKKDDASPLPLLAHTQPDEQAVESLRSLRTSLQFALMEAENNLVTISGAAPEAGKSFLSANFAYVMAGSGKKILLVDADLRKGKLERYFAVAKSPGLSEVLAGEHAFDDAVQRGKLQETLDFLPAGVYSPNPSELLMSEAFKRLLETVKGQYDLVIIDTPPILAVTDPAIVAQYASTNFMVLRAGQHPLREIQIAFRRFEQNGVHIKGAIFNGIEVAKGRYGGQYGYRYYGYSYSAK